MNDTRTPTKAPTKVDRGPTDAELLRWPYPTPDATRDAQAALAVLRHARQLADAQLAQAERQARAVLAASWALHPEDEALLRKHLLVIKAARAALAIR